MPHYGAIIETRVNKALNKDFGLFETNIDRSLFRIFSWVVAFLKCSEMCGSKFSYSLDESQEVLLYLETQ